MIQDRPDRSVLQAAWDAAGLEIEDRRARMREAWDATEPTAGEALIARAKSAPKAVLDVAASMLEGVGVGLNALGRDLPGTPKYADTPMASIVRRVRGAAPEIAPNMQGDPIVGLVGGLASIVPTIVPAAAGARLAGATGALAGAAGAGVAAQAGSAYDDAIRGGKDPETARTAAALNAPSGLLEVFPWGRMGANAAPFLARLLERTGPTLSKTIGTGAEEALLNEIPQSWWEEQVQYSIGNREEALSLLEVAQEVGPTSFLAGAIFGGASAYLDRGNRAAARSTTTSTQKASNDPGAATPEPRTTSSDVVTGGAAPTFQDEQGAAEPETPVAVAGAIEDAGAAAPDTPREAPPAPASFDEPLREAVRRFAAQPEVALDREPDVFEAPAEIQERASRVGARVAFVDLGEDAPADGFYDPETSTILVNARSPDPRSLLDHELVHFASAEYPDLYDQFRVAVEEVAPDVLARQSADRAKRQAAARGPDAPAISSAVLEEEALAELVQGIPKLLHLAETNPSAAVRIAQHSPGLFQRLADMVIDFAYRIGLTKEPSVRRLITDLELSLAGAETELGAQRGAFVALKVAELQRRMAGLSPLRAGRRLKTTKTPPPTATEPAPAKPESPKNLAVDEAPVVAAMPKGRIIGTDLTGEPVYEKVERGDVARQGAGIEQPKQSQVGLFDEEGGLFEAQATARDQGVATLEVVTAPPVQRKTEEERLREIAPWKMTLSELRRAGDAARAYEKGAEVDVFGEEGAKRYRRLQRTANSTSDLKAADRAADELERIEAALTEEQRRRLFGIGEIEPSSELYREYERAVEAAETATSEADLVDVVANALPKLGTSTDPSTMNHSERLAYARMRAARDRAEDAGWNLSSISSAALKRAASKYGDAADAEFMLGHFLRATDPAPAPKPLPLTLAASSEPSAPATPKAKPKAKPKLPLRMRESLQKRAAKTGSIRDWIAAHGGIAYDASLDDFTDKRQGKKRFGGPVVHAKGSSKGGHWDDVLRSLREAGFFPGKDTNELDINDLIDALETDRKHPDVAEDETERLAIQFESDRQEAEERALDEGAEIMFGRPYAELTEEQRSELRAERERRQAEFDASGFTLFERASRYYGRRSRERSEASLPLRSSAESLLREADARVSVLKAMDSGRGDAQPVPGAADDYAEERAAARGSVDPREDERLAKILAGVDVPQRIEPNERLSVLVKGYVEDVVPAFDVVGKTVRDARDAATLFWALRSPFVERVSYIVTVGGEVWRSGVFSVGTFNSSLLPPAEMLRALDGFQNKQDVKLWIAHNHPSGDPEPSAADTNVYRRVEELVRARGADFGGVVTNGDEFYGWLSEPDRYGLRWAASSYDPEAQGLTRPYEAVPFEKLEPILGPQDAVRITKRVQVDPDAIVHFMLDNRMKLRAVQVRSGAPSPTDYTRDMDSQGAAFSVFAAESPRQRAALRNNWPDYPGASDIVTPSTGETSTAAGLTRPNPSASFGTRHPLGSTLFPRPGDGGRLALPLKRRASPQVPSPSADLPASGGQASAVGEAQAARPDSARGRTGAQPLSLPVAGARDRATGRLPAAARAQGGRLALPLRRLTDTEAFKAWFGDSKVVDADGKPLVVYHGTGDLVTEFDLDHPNRRDTGWLGTGVYVTTRPSIADAYASMKAGASGQNVIPLYARVENPYYATSADKQRLQLISSRDGKSAGRLAADQFTQALIARGHDGVILEYAASEVGQSNASREIVVFSPSAVKSATGNVGAFDASNPDIRFALPLDLKRKPEGPVQVGGPEETRIEAVRRWVQDRFLRVRKLESDLGARGVSDAETLFHGRLQENLRQIELAGNEAAAILREHKISLEDAGRFLIARHQPRRDAVIAERGGPPNGSGMEPEVAAKIRADARKNPGFAKIAALNDRLTRETRDRLVEFGLLSQEERDAWESIFGQTYTPLKTSIEPAEAVIRDPDPYQVKGPESERAEGRADEASNPLVQVLTDAAEVVYRAEVNRVYLQFLDLVDSKPAPWLWERSDRGGKGVLTMKVDGEPVHVRIHDPLALRAMQALRPDHVGGLLRFVSTVSRTYSALHTSRNPEFVLSNLARDLQTAALNLSSEERVAFGARVVKGAGRSLRAVWNVLRDPDAKGELEQYFREFRQDGGLTDWTGRPTFAQRQKDIEKRVARSGITQKMLDLWDFVEDANASVENAVRLSTYVEARRAGATRANAAVMAKEVTVNFSKKGEVGGALNALYLFFSARANGTVRLAQAMRRHPKRAAAVAGSLVAAGFAMSALNRAFGGDDEKDEQNWWSKQLAANKARYWQFQHPDGTTWRVPMVQGWGVFVVVGQMLEHAIFDDRITEGDAAAQALLVGLDAISPVTAGPSIAQTVSPWFLDPAIQIADNEDFAGRTLYPERFPNDLRPYAVIPDRFASPESRDLSTWLNESTGGDHTRRGKLDIPPGALDYLFGEAGGGAGRFVTRAVEWFSKVSTGEERAWRDVPVVNRFVGDAPNTYARDFREARESITQEAASKRGGARYEPQLAELAPELRRVERAVREARDSGDDKRAEWLMVDFNRRYRNVRDATRDLRVGVNR